MKKKVALLALTVMIFLLSLTALVACDPDDNGGEWFLAINEQEFNTLLDKMITYVDNYRLAHIDEQVATVINFEALEDSDDYDGIVGTMTLNIGIRADDPNEDSVQNNENLVVYYFDTTENATEKLSELEQDYDEMTLVQHESIIVGESRNGLYDDINATAVSQNTNEIYKFYRDSLNVELHNSDNTYCFGYVYLGKDNVDCSIYGRPQSGNRDKEYKLVRSEVVGDEFDTIVAYCSEYHTEDSYCIKKNINGVEYVQYYLQPKIGQWFSDLEEGKCSLDKIYYDGNSVTISAYHEGKLVVKFGQGLFEEYDDEFLTDIYYDGTIEQWNAIEKSMYNSERFFAARNIHCSDGVIEKTADAE